MRLHSKLMTGVLLVSCLVLTQCKPAPTSPQAEAAKATCETIDQAEKNVLQAYAENVKAANSAWETARDGFESDLNACLLKARMKTPCDDENKNLENAYHTAMGDISNDVAYAGYKAAKAKWDACQQNYTAEQKANDANVHAAEKACEDTYKSSVDAAMAAYLSALNTAKAARDTALAELAALREKCKKPSSSSSSVSSPSSVSSTSSSSSSSSSAPRVATGIGNSSAGIDDGPCSIPGSDGKPRTGKATDFGPSDIAINLIVAVAEDVTKGPVPTGIISDQLFAGMVAVKIRTRIAQMTIDAANADEEGRSARARLIERKIKKYEDALQIWGKIAEGRPPNDIRERVIELQGGEQVFCPPAVTEVHTTVGEVKIHYGN